jgi:hypothetical protein
MNFWAADDSKIKVREEHERLASAKRSASILGT